MFKITKNFATSFTAAALLSVLALMPDAAFANSNALEGVVSNGLCVIIKALTGEVGRAVATFAVLFLGIGAFFGKVNWGLALMFAAGIVAIFGSAQIASSIAAGSGPSGGTGLTC